MISADTISQSVVKSLLMVFVEMLLLVAEVAVLGLPLADSEVAVLADFDAIISDLLLLDVQTNRPLSAGYRESVLIHHSMLELKSQLRWETKETSSNGCSQTHKAAITCAVGRRTVYVYV